MRTRPRWLMAVLVCALPSVAIAQTTTYTWQNSGTSWTTAGNWSPSGPPSTSGIAQFNTTGTLAGTINNPILNSATTIRSLVFSNTASGGGWTLSGTGSLTAGSSTTSGLRARGVGTYNIALGDGSTTSLSLTGTNSAATTNGAIDVGTGATLVLSGNTVASTGGRAVSLRGGTLTLDNSAGNPSSERLTLGSTNINFAGGGSTLLLKGTAGGTTFSGMQGTTVSLAAGDGTIEVAQPGVATGRTSVTFSSLERTNTSATMNFTSSGSGTLGGSETTDPRILFATTPSLTNGVISDNGGAALGYAIYQGSSFAGYDISGSNRGVIAVSTNDVSGSLTTISTQNSNLTGNASIANGTAVAYNTLKISPSSPGQSLSIGSGGALNTVAILHAGTNDYSITGGAISGGATRYIYVTNSSTTLSISSALGGTANNNPVNFAGMGFIALNGTNNQVAFTTANVNVNLTGATLRVTSTNFDLTTTTAPVLRFRGGVIEYDVSGGSYTFNRTLGTTSGTVNWSAASGPSVNSGGGGFSAFVSDLNSNTSTLTINLGGSNSSVTWGGQTGGDVQFVQDGYALKFGSTKSNATVKFDNPLALDGGTAGNYQLRQVDVTKGVGNAADKTQFARVVSGSSSTDLIKTGNGVLEFTAANTYSGNTLIHGGELRVTGQTGTNSGTGTGNVIVMSGAMLSGTGQALPGAGNQITILSGGTLRGDSGTGTGTLTVGNTVIQAGGNLFANLGSSGTSSKLTLGANTLDLKTNSVLKLDDVTGFNSGSGGTYTIATLDSGDNILVDGVGNRSESFDFGTYIHGATPTRSGIMYIDPSGFALNNGDKLTLQRSGDNLVLTFSPIPEPASLLAVCGLAVGGVALVRRVRRKPVEVTPAA